MDVLLVRRVIFDVRLDLVQAWVLSLVGPCVAQLEAVADLVDCLRQHHLVASWVGRWPVLVHHREEQERLLLELRKRARE